METLTRMVTASEDGWTVNRFLRTVMGFSARGVSRLKYTETGILVNGERAFTNRILRPGDTVQAEAGDHRPPKVLLVPGDWPLEILWEDEWLLFVNKPAQMTAHASNFDPDAPTVAGALAFQRGGNFLFHPVNRLDRGTTGLMAVAKSGYVHDLLRRALHTDRFRREYLAVCTGCPSPETGVIRLPIGRDERSLVARQVRPDGAPSVTRYAVLSTALFPDDRRPSFPDDRQPSFPGDRRLSLVWVQPETGRTHQIRVHFAALGCPLLGDWLYGREEPDMIGRPALHSHRVRMTHPVTGEALCLEAPLPEDMAGLAERILSG